MVNLPNLTGGFQSASTGRSAWGVIAVCFCLSATVLRAEESPRLLTLPGLPSQAAPEQDDATLHAVQLIGTSRGWAVGDRGAIWKTEDGGETWRFVRVDAETGSGKDDARGRQAERSVQPSASLLEGVSWRSVCFLTDRVGWIAGGMLLPFGRAHQGVVLFTEDGGATWQPRGPRTLPFLRFVRFFDLDRGIAVGERTPTFPGGVILTTDGGRTWLPMNASQSGAWTTAAFFSEEEGVVAGDLGRQALCAHGLVTEAGAVSRGLQGFHAASADRFGQGWLAGDGGLLLRTTNRGVSWSPPAGALPRELADFVDFHCVSQIGTERNAREGEQIWASGTPGSVIWHSPDGGETWQPRPTGDPAPLYAMHFINARQGVAVGAFGRICVTPDGGRTWRNVRGAGRRLACLAVHTHADQVNFRFLTRWAREEGYRTAVTLATRRDVGADAHAAAERETRLSQAVMAAGGNEARIDWRLPLALPGLDRDESRLVEEWLLLSDRRLPQILLGHLVSRIRLWRPDLILVDDPAPDDAATRLIHQAVLRAVEQAGEPHRYPEHLAIGGLSPWKVSRVVAQGVKNEGSGSRGQATNFLDPLEILPRLGTTLDLAAAPAEARFRTSGTGAGAGERFTVIAGSNIGPGGSVRSLFTDLNLPPDSPARRPVPIIRSLDYDLLVREANHRRTIAGISRTMTAGPLQGAQLLGQLNEIIKPLSREQAALQLAELAGTYRQHGQWALAEATYAELITHYADQPAAVEAMVWLMHFWTSGEMNWQRLRELKSTNTNVQIDPAVVRTNFEKALEIAKRQGTETSRLQSLEQLQSPLDRRSAPSSPVIGNLGSVVANGSQAGNQHRMLLTRWQEMASLVSDGLQEAYPRLAEAPEIQFATAALMRRRDQPKRSDAIYDRFLKTISDDPWHRAALGESFLLRPGAESPKPVAFCKRTRIPPVLDGDLTDPCWSQAEEIRLGSKGADSSFVGTSQSGPGRVRFLGPEPIVMFSYDSEYLYVAASVPIHADLPKHPPQLPGRERDADLDGYDRISLQFDVDRDYATYYRFDVDQRGWTREACWENWSYDPEWYVAAARDHVSWRIECAIPLESLLPAENVPGGVWAVGVTRIMPGIGVTSWTDSGGGVPHPPLFGLLRFEP